MIIPMLQDHWGDVRRIYQEGIETGQATFETEAPNCERFDSSHNTDCRLIAVENDSVAGWAALVPFSSRPVYRGVAEASVYVSLEHRGRGVGKLLLGSLVDKSELAGYWTLLAKIFPANRASLALVKRYGFRRVGVFERIGNHYGEWRDVVLLERSSTTQRSPG